MKNFLIILTTMFIFTSASADHHHLKAAAEVRNATNAFNLAYEVNDVDGYFDMYAEGAMLYFYGDRWEVSNYYDYWKKMIGAGGGVEKNTATDVQVKVTPGGNTAVVGAFIQNSICSLTVMKYTEDNKLFLIIFKKIDGEWKIIADMSC